MYLNHFEKTDMARLEQILSTLKDVHGITMRFDLEDPVTEEKLFECVLQWDARREQIVSESQFNSYQQNPDYIKSMLILEAARIMLKEIAPKRRPKSVNESILDEKVLGDSDQSPHVRLSMQISDIAARIPQKNEAFTAFSNELAALADNLLHQNALTGQQQDMLSWLRGLPKPLTITAIADNGARKYGIGLAQQRRQEVGSWPSVDEAHGKKDQDGDGDGDFADVRIARMVARGIPKPVAVAKTRRKTYNKESASNGILGTYKKHPISGIYQDSYYQDAHGNGITYDKKTREYRHYDKAKKEWTAHATLDELIAHLHPENKTELVSEISKEKLGSYISAVAKLDPDQVTPSREKGIERASKKYHGKDEEPAVSVKEDERSTDISLSSFKRKAVPGVYHYDHYEDDNGNWIQIRQDKSEFAFHDASTGDIMSFATVDDLKAHINRPRDDVNETRMKFNAKKGMMKMDRQDADQRHGIYIGGKLAKTANTKGEAENIKARSAQFKGAEVKKIVEDAELTMPVVPSITPTPGTEISNQIPGSVNPAVRRAHHYEYQASMARSELYRNAKYATAMLQQVDPHGEVHPWIAGALTKAAGLLDKIYHYLDYHKTFEPDKLPENVEDADLGETSGGVTRQNLMLIAEYSTKLFDMINPGDKLEGWVAMKLTTASEAVSCCKHYLDYVQFETHAVEDHFAEMKKFNKKKPGDMKKHDKTRMPTSLNESEDLAKAATIIDAKNMASKVQEIAEDLAEMSVEDLMPLVDIMRAQFGPEAAEGFNDSVKSVLNSLLDQTVKAKHVIDDAIDTLNQGGVPSGQSDLSAPDAGDAMQADVSDDSEISKDLGALAGTDDVSSEPFEPLGRAKKPEISESFKVGQKVNITNPSATPRHEIVSVSGDMITVKKPNGEKVTISKSRLVRANPNLDEGKIPDAFKKNNKKMKDQAAEKKGKKPATSKDMSESYQSWSPPWAGRRVRIKPKGGMPEFHGKTGTIIDKEGRMYRVNLDEPVEIPGVGRVRDDLWEPSYLTTLRSKKEESVGMPMQEKAPPGKKAEDFIKGNKESFRKRYGDRWQEVLYATAWKKFGAKSESYDRATQDLQNGKKSVTDLEKRLAVHSRDFKKKISEGLASDPLKTGYGLEGDVILERISYLREQMEDARRRMKDAMHEGVSDMLNDIRTTARISGLERLLENAPYGVVFAQPDGSKKTKMFESSESRDKWISYQDDDISVASLIDPETLTDAIRQARGKS